MRQSWGQIAAFMIKEVNSVVIHHQDESSIHRRWGNQAFSRGIERSQCTASIHRTMDFRLGKKLVVRHVALQKRSVNCRFGWRLLVTIARQGHVFLTSRQLGGRMGRIGYIRHRPASA